MKQTPRYIRLAFLLVSVLTLALAKAYEQHLWFEYESLNSSYALAPYLAVTRLGVALTFLTVALFGWLFVEQKVN